MLLLIVLASEFLSLDDLFFVNIRLSGSQSVSHSRVADVQCSLRAAVAVIVTSQLQLSTRIVMTGLL